MYLSIYLSILQIQADLARPPAPTLQQNLENLFTHEHCPDFKLIYLNTVFNVHKSILLARYLQDFIGMSAGVYIEFEFIFLPPSPFLIHIFSPPKCIMKRGCAAQAKNFEPFFCNFVYFKPIAEKICILFIIGGKKYAFPPLFLSPFNSFFPNLLFGHIFAKQKNIHPCMFAMKCNHPL